MSYVELQNFMWHDLHSATLDLLCQSIKHVEVADRFVELSLPRYMTFVSTTMYHKLESLNVLLELSKFPKHQEVTDEQKIVHFDRIIPLQTLHSIGFTKIIGDFLEAGETDPITIAIELMANCKASADEFLERGVVRTLFGNKF